MSKAQTIHLGFEAGSGEPVSIPLGHTFVTGQTRLSGKTSTLRAIVLRSGRRALAFATKRGEDFEGRPIRPYLPREGERPIPWRLVETILASALGQRSMKYERLWIVNAAKGARSLADVRENVTRLMGKAKGGSADMYMLLGEYLDLVLPEMQALRASDVLDLEPGLNVMDLSGVGSHLQALVIRAALERINAHETGILTVFPEAWEFAPRGRAAPAKDEAIAMARKGAVLGNYLLCDSQDIAGVDTVVRQAASVWILGVQRELNELKRTIDSIPAGIARPKPQDVATLELGHFYACWGRSIHKVYVQPAWMEAQTARAIARGDMAVEEVARPRSNRAAEPAPVEHRCEKAAVSAPPARSTNREPIEPIEQPPTEDDEMSKEDIDGIRSDLKELTTAVGGLVKAMKGGAHVAHAPTPGPASAPVGDEDTLYQRFKARLMEEAPQLLKVLTVRPELEVSVERRVIQVDGATTEGRLAKLIADDWFKDVKRFSEALRELERTGPRLNNKTLANAFKGLVNGGFLTKEGGDGYKAVPGMKVNIKRG